MGRFWKMCVPNFRDAGTVTEIPTCLKSGITENLSCLRSEIKLYSSVATQDSHPGSSMQCTVLLAIARWGEGATETVGETRICLRVQEIRLLTLVYGDLRHDAHADCTSRST